jgi:gas vesicle protein
MANLIIIADDEKKTRKCVSCNGSSRKKIVEDRVKEMKLHMDEVKNHIMKEKDLIREKVGKLKNDIDDIKSVLMSHIRTSTLREKATLEHKEEMAELRKELARMKN